MGVGETSQTCETSAEGADTAAQPAPGGFWAYLRPALFPHRTSESNAPWRGLVGQIVLVAMGLLFYLGVRAFTQGAESLAFDNARRLLEWEHELGIAWEQRAQNLILDSQTWIDFWNVVYVWGYWTVLIGSLAGLYRFSRKHYVMLRNALFVSGGIGLVIFAFFPVAPPRFLDGFTDTVSDASRSSLIGHPSGLINKFAAMPSFHVGWLVIVGVVLAQASPWIVLKIAAVVPALLMALAVVFTGNHFIVDAIAGSAVSLLGLYIAHRIMKRVERDAADETSRRVACT
ncbi:MAG: phosphatase PAP2 family protein [Acidimicrobiales bacterium]